jgi:hypothetical protein
MQYSEDDIACSNCKHWLPPWDHDPFGWCDSPDAKKHPENVDGGEPTLDGAGELRTLAVNYCRYIVPITVKGKKRGSD